MAQPHGEYSGVRWLSFMSEHFPFNCFWVDPVIPLPAVHGTVQTFTTSPLFRLHIPGVWSVLIPDYAGHAPGFTICMDVKSEVGKMNHFC